MLTGADLRGVTVATVMPFDASGAIDWASYERLLAYCAVPDDIDAVFVNGHAGEVAALTIDERAEVICRTRAIIGTDKPLLAGVVPHGIADAIEAAQAAAEAGADGYVVFPPASLGGGAAATDAPVAFFEAVTHAVDLSASVFLYPQGSGLSYPTPVLARIAALPRVIAVKEGSASLGIYEDNLRALRAEAPGVALLASNFDWFMAQLAVGGDGLLSGLASLAPRQLADLWAAAEAEDLAAMRRENDRLFPLVRAIYGPSPIIDMHTRIKVGLQALGVIANARPRLPLLPAAPDISEAVIRGVGACGLDAGASLRAPRPRTRSGP